MSVWLDEHWGYTIEAVSRDPRINLLRFDSPEIEVRFLEEWGQYATPKPELGGYEVLWVELDEIDRNAHENGMSVWMSKNSAFDIDYNLRHVQGRYGVKPRYESAKQAFEAKWGQCYKPVETGNGVCYVGAWPSLPVRDIPQPFIDYLNGKIEWADVKPQPQAQTARPNLKI